MADRTRLSGLLAEAEGLWAVLKARGSGKRGRPRREIAAVNAYQIELEAIFAEWAADAAAALGAEDDEIAFGALLDELLAELQADLIALGRQRLPEAVGLGLGDEPPFGAAMRELADALDRNEAYIRDSLIPALRTKVGRTLEDGDALAALGSAAGTAVILGALTALLARTGMYAGAYWEVYNAAVGQRADLRGQRIYWEIDKAPHLVCPDCLTWGDREYPSYQEMLVQSGGIGPAHGTACLHRCRCRIVPVRD